MSNNNNAQWNPQWWANPTKCGELKQKGALQSWKARWFVLQNDKLFYFKAKAVSLSIFK